jgi:transporter family-2 protein
MNTALVVLVAIAGGIAVALQGQALGVMEARAGTTASVFITYASGGLAIAALTVALRGAGLSEMRGAPWWVYVAGLMGLVIIGSIGYATARIGLFAGLSVLLVSQFATSAAIDHFGWLGAVQRPLDGGRLAGLALLIAGAWLIIR